MLLARVSGYLRVEISVTFFNIDSDKFSDHEIERNRSGLGYSRGGMASHLKLHEKSRRRSLTSGGGLVSAQAALHGLVEASGLSR